MELFIRQKPGVNFINILRASFSYQSKLSSFSLITFGLAIFWHQNIGEKFASKMLVKLTPELRDGAVRGSPKS